jgi:mono/diheme cytochrome c family protein
MRRFYLGLFVYAFLVIFASFGAYAAEALGAPSDSPSASAARKPAPALADFVGAKTCAMCHKDEANGLSTNPHSKLALEHDGKGVTCEGCHGPGKAHVQSGGDPSKIFSFAKATPKAVEEHCLECHQGDLEAEIRRSLREPHSGN